MSDLGITVYDGSSIFIYTGWWFCLKKDSDNKDNRSKLELDPVIWKKVQRKYTLQALLIMLGIGAIQIIVTALVILIWMLYKKQMGYDINTAQISSALKGGNIYNIILFLNTVFILVFGVVSYRKIGFEIKEPDYKKTFSLPNTVAIIVSGLSLMIFFTSILTILYKAFPYIFETYNNLINMLTADFNALNMFYIMILGPVAEEMIFRGAIYRRLEFSYGYIYANIIQAVLFGVYHGNLVQGITAFFMGLFLGVVLKKTESILPAIIIHMLGNVTSIGLSIFSKYGMISVNTKNTIVLIMFIMSWIGAVSSLIYFMKDKKSFEENGESL